MTPQSTAHTLRLAKSPLYGIYKYIERAVNLSAPEQRDQLTILRDSLEIEFRVDVINGGVNFFAGTNTGKRYIKVGLAAMERLWAYCYGFTVFYDIARQKPQGTLIIWKNEPKAHKAWALLRWAYKGEQERKRLRWDKDFPKPGVRNSDWYIENTDKFFTLVLGFIVLHEVGHHQLKHTDRIALPFERVSDELAADKFAFNLMLENCPRDDNQDKHFIARANAISTGLALLSGLELGVTISGQRSHPKIPERLLSFFEMYIPEPPGGARIQQYPMYFAAIVLSAFMQNADIHFPKGHKFTDLTDFFIQALDCFP